MPSGKSATCYQQTLTFRHQTPNFVTKHRNVGNKWIVINVKGSYFADKPVGKMTKAIVPASVLLLFT